MTTDMRASLTVTADASSVVTEARRAVEALRDLRRAAADGVSSGMAGSGGQDDTARRMAAAQREVQAGFDASAEAAMLLRQQTAAATQEIERMAAAQARAAEQPANANAAPAVQADAHMSAWADEEVRRSAEAQQAWTALEASLNPLIRAERELADARAVVSAAQERGVATDTQAARALADLERRYEALAAAQKLGPSGAQLREAAAAEEQAVRRLMASLDPAAQAEKELAKARDMVTAARKRGVITDTEATRSLSLIDVQQKKLATSKDSLFASIGGGQMALKQTAFQVNQIAQMGAVTGNWMQAVTVQSADLLTVFGTWGILAGGVTAVMGPLIAAFLMADDGGKTLDETVSGLSDSMGRMKDALAAAKTDLFSLSKEFGPAAGDARELNMALLDLAKIEAEQSLKKSLDKIGSSIGDLASFGVTKISSLQKEFNLTERSAYDIAAAMQKFSSATTQEDKVKAAAAVAEAFSRARYNADGASDAALTFGRSTAQAAIEALRLKGYTEEADRIAKKFGDDQSAVNDEVTKAAQERQRVAENELSLNRVIAVYGKDSRQAEDERNRIAREGYELDLERAGIYGDQRDKLLEIWDANAGVVDATAQWQSTMAGVRGEVEGILSALGSMAGGLVDRAAKQAELQALQAGSTVADAAAAGRAKRREAQYNARVMEMGGGIFGQAVAGAQRWWDEGTDALDQQLSAARDLARKNDRKSGGAGGASRGLSAVASVKEELARLRPSYEADVAAAEAWRDKALAALDKTKAGYGEFADDVDAVFKEKLAKAYEEDLKRRTDWAAGVARAQIDMKKEVMDWGDVSEGIFKKVQKSGEDAFVSLALTGKANMGDLVDFVVEQFARLAYEQMIAPGMSVLMQALTTGISSALGFTMPTTAAAKTAAVLPTHHTGSPGVMRSYDLGAGYGDTKRSNEHLAMIRDGEQIMTSRALENAGALISAMSAVIGSQATQGQMIDARPIINIENASSAEVSATVEETTTSRGQRQWRLRMSDATATGISARGGKAEKALSQFGVRRPGIPRP